MRRLDFRASFRRRLEPASSATTPMSSLPGIRAVMLSLAALCVSLVPTGAAAYALAGEGRIVRIDAVIAWERDKQVLALLPHLHAVGEGAVLVIPVPPGTELVIAPDPDMFQAQDISQDEEAEEDEGTAPAAENGEPSPASLRLSRPSGRPAKASSARDDERSLEKEKHEGGPDARAPEDDPEGDRDLLRHGLRERRSDDRGDAERRHPAIDRRELQAPGGRPGIPPDSRQGRRLREPMDRARIMSALRRRQPTLVRLEQAPRILDAAGVAAALEEILGAEPRDLLPAEALDAYIDKGWTFAVVPVPAREGRMRFGPMAFSMAVEAPTLPLRLAAASGPHRLSMRFVAFEDIVSLDPFSSSLGLRHTQRPMPVDDGLRAWLNASGFEGRARWRVRGLSAGPLNTERFSLDSLDAELTITVPSSLAREARAEAEVETAKAEKAAGERRSSSRSCGCLGAPSGGGAALAGLLALAILLCSRRPRRRGCAA